MGIYTSQLFAYSKQSERDPGETKAVGRRFKLQGYKFIILRIQRFRRVYDGIAGKLQTGSTHGGNTKQNKQKIHTKKQRGAGLINALDAKR